MASKRLLVVGFVLVTTLVLFSSEVSARELVEETAHAGAKNKEDVDDAEQYGRGGSGGYPGGGYGGYPGGGSGRYPGGGYYPPWRRPYPCRWGCCGHGLYGRCRCCAYPGEIPDATLQTEP